MLGLRQLIETYRIACHFYFELLQDDSKFSRKNFINLNHSSTHGLRLYTSVQSLSKIVTQISLKKKTKKQKNINQNLF